MSTNHLYEIFKRLSQNSVDSVQDGDKFTSLDEYLHVDRPIENILLNKMQEIDSEGGGIIFLVGSAGDGKSHLISRMKVRTDWDDGCFYNDATVSSSPNKTAVETLKEALSAFKDANITFTSHKLVLAINLGKLNSFIEDEVVKQEYSKLVKATEPIFDDDDTTPPIESSRIKVIEFETQQMFEFYLDRDDAYPVDSNFLSTLLKRIASPTESNPFYKAYKDDLESGIDTKDPIIVNYELLLLPEVQHTIVMSAIEAIVRFKLIITPREALDFIHSIIVYPHILTYKEKSDFFEALLPSLLYCGGSNRIQRAVGNLDPMKESSKDNDKELSVLFTSYSIPEGFLPEGLPAAMISRINQFYDNNGIDIERTAKFVFRLKHLLHYTSECDEYKSFLSVLAGVFRKDKNKFAEIYNLVHKSIPQYYGAYYSKEDMVPLNIQGGQYRLFAELKMDPQPIETPFDKEHPNEFYLRFNMTWHFSTGDVMLRMDYPLFAYIYHLKQGKLALSYENERDLNFGRFIRQLESKCAADRDLTVVKTNSQEMKLHKSSFDQITLS